MSLVDVVFRIVGLLVLSIGGAVLLHAVGDTVSAVFGALEGSAAIVEGIPGVDPSRRGGQFDHVLYDVGFNRMLAVGLLIALGIGGARFARRQRSTVEVLEE